MGLHWENSHFGSDVHWTDQHFGGELNGVPFVGIDFAGEINGVDFLGIDFAGEMNGVPGVGIDFGADVTASTVDFGCDFGIEPASMALLGVGLVTGAAATGHHLLSIHHLLNGHKHHASPAHAAAAAISVHDAENNALSGPSGADPYQLGG